MATLLEPDNPTYPPGIYRLETTDPVMGGEDGIDNVPIKQLAERTKYLKVRADQVDLAKGEEASLPARMDIIQAMAEATGPEMQSAIIGLAQFGLDQAGQANAAVSHIRTVGSQRGSMAVTNRGVISGCNVTKSSTAARNLNISAGHCFAQGRSFPVAAQDNAASVPPNPENWAIAAFAYLHPEGYNNYSLAVASAWEEIPESGIFLYEIDIPDGNTDGTDPYLSEVVLTDFRRVEPDFPAILDDPVIGLVPLTVLPDNNYHLALYAIDAHSAQRLPAEAVWAVPSTNGFYFYLSSTADNVVVFWQVFALNEKEASWPEYA